MERQRSWLLAGLVALHAALLAWSAARHSVTIDEYAHLPAGVAYWRYGEWSIYNQSPPLLRLAATWPAFLVGVNVPPVTPFRDNLLKDRYWNYADAFTDRNRQNYRQILFAARLPMIALSCAGLCLVYAVSRRLYGRTAGVASAAVYALCPNVAAHGSIVGTDVGTAIFTLAAVWAWISFCRKPTPGRCGIAAVALAGALACKFSTVLLVPLMALIGLWAITIDRRRVLLIIVGFVASLLISMLLLNLLYGYHNSFRALGVYEFDSVFMKSLQQRLPAWTPVPLPGDLVEGFDAAKWEIEQPFPAFLLGEEYRGTNWLYYPLALLSKTPISILLLVALAAISMLPRAMRRPWTDRETPLAGALLFLGLTIMMLATVNIGVRYLLPALPIAYVLIGRLFATESPAGTVRFARRAGWVLIAVLAVENLTVAPRYLTFFNAAAGGPVGGQAILNDSNVDWGQGLIELREWMHSRQVDRVQLAYFGRVDPGVYGIDYTPANRAGGERYIVVSSYFRAGLAYRTPTPEGMSGWIRLPFAAALRRTEPVAIIGNVLYVYDRADVAEAMRQRDADSP